MTEPRQSNVPVRTPNLPPWAAEPVAIAAAIAVIGGSLLVASLYVEWAHLLLAVFALAWLLVCVSATSRADPIGFLSIALPLVVLVAIATVVPSARVPFDLLALVWIGLWTFLGSQAWPVWSRLVLRRMRPGSAQFAVHAADVRIYRAWPNGREIFRELSELGQLETPATRPVIDGIYAFWDATNDTSRDTATMERLRARLREERDRLWVQPVPRLLRWLDPAVVRPSRSTRLEYRFPRVEALVALGTTAELREMASAAAALAARGVGVSTPSLEASLARAARGEPQPDQIEDVRAQLDSIRDRRLANIADTDTWSSEEEARQFGQLSALSSARYALEADGSTDWAADAVYEAIRSADPDGPVPYEALLAEILGPERAAQAVEVQPNGRRVDPAATPETGRLLGPFWMAIGAASRTRRGALGLIAVGLVAGALGTFIRQGVRVFDWDLGAVDHVVGILAVGLVAYVLLRRQMGRPQWFDLMLLLILSSLAQDLFGPAFDATQGIISPLIPDVWSAVYDNATTALPYAPWHAVLFAGVLLATALIVRTRDVDKLGELAPAAAAVGPPTP